MKNIVLILFMLFIGFSTMAQESLIGNKIHSSEEYGHSIYVYDHRPETLAFMDKNELQGGGPTWMALIQAALELESPQTLNSIEFDDEADGVLVRSESKRSLEIVQSFVSILMSDEGFMRKCIQKATTGGYIE